LVFFLLDLLLNWVCALGKGLEYLLKWFVKQLERVFSSSAFFLSLA